MAPRNTNDEKLRAVLEEVSVALRAAVAAIGKAVPKSWLMGLSIALLILIGFLLGTVVRSGDGKGPSAASESGSVSVANQPRERAHPSPPDPTEHESHPHAIVRERYGPTGFNSGKAAPATPRPEDQFISALSEAVRQAELDQRQKNKRTLEMLSTPPVCRACDGSGSYRFVNGAGRLQMNECPHCRGLGRPW